MNEAAWDAITEIVRGTHPASPENRAYVAAARETTEGLRKGEQGQWYGRAVAAYHRLLGQV